MYNIFKVRVLAGTRIKKWAVCVCVGLFLYLFVCNINRKNVLTDFDDISWIRLRSDGASIDLRTSISISIINISISI